MIFEPLQVDLVTDYYNDKCVMLLEQCGHLVLIVLEKGVESP